MKNKNNKFIFTLLRSIYKRLQNHERISANILIFSCPEF